LASAFLVATFRGDRPKQASLWDLWLLLGCAD
jgi:hypothetical protein